MTEEEMLAQAVALSLAEAQNNDRSSSNHNNITNKNTSGSTTSGNGCDDDDAPPPLSLHQLQQLQSHTQSSSQPLQSLRSVQQSHIERLKNILPID